jgi:hypothetical protein
MGIIFFNSGFKNDSTKLFPSIVLVIENYHRKLSVVLIVASIVISRYLHCTILVTISAKSFFQQNFNLK